MNNIFQHNYNISKEDRERIHNHKAFLILFTGLSNSGKSTIANALEVKLNGLNISTYTLDGDNIRLGISKDLTFSQKDRTENIRRIAEIGNLFVNAGVVTLACFVSPYIKDRDNIKKIVVVDLNSAALVPSQPIIPSHYPKYSNIYIYIYIL